MKQICSAVPKHGRPNPHAQEDVMETNTHSDNNKVDQTGNWDFKLEITRSDNNTELITGTKKAHFSLM